MEDEGFSHLYRSILAIGTHPFFPFISSYFFADLKWALKRFPNLFLEVDR